MTDVAEKLETVTTQADLRMTRTCDSTSETDADQVHDLTDAVAARDRFIARIGHELRNSLAPMVLLAEQFGVLAEGSQPPGKLLARVAMLTNNLNKLISTIGRIVEIADLRRGKLQLAPSTTDLADVVGEACGELAREAAAAGSELVVEARESVIGRWDRARVKQIVSNLVGNAIRYGAGGRIEISVRVDAGDGALTIRDHGPGFDPDALPRVFDCFEHAGVKRHGGLCLGLWVVKTLCTAMQGSVTVENCTDGGARFCVVLPRG